MSIALLDQVALEPFHALQIHVVRRLVEQNDLGLLEQHLAEADAHLPAAGEGGDREVGVARREAHGPQDAIHFLFHGARVGVVELRLQLRHAIQGALHRLGVVAGTRQLRLALGVLLFQALHLFEGGHHLLLERSLLVELLAELLPEERDLDVGRTLDQLA